MKPHAQYLAVAVSDRYRDSLNELALSENLDLLIQFCFFWICQT